MYTPCAKAAPFASCLYFRVLTVDGFARQSETRIRAHLASSPVFVSVTYPLCTLPSPNLPASDAICNPSPRFDVTLFGLFRRNANLRRSALSALRLLRVMYFCVHSPQTSAAFAHNLYLRVLTVHGFAWNGRNAYILRNLKSSVEF